MIEKSKSFLLLFAGGLLLSLLFACTSTSRVDNNSLTVRDLADCLTLYKVKIDYISPLDPMVLRADSAMEIGISGKRVAAYYFNVESEIQCERIDRIKKNKYVYIMGLKFPAMVVGSYALVNVNINPQKQKIMMAFKKFKMK